MLFGYKNKQYLIMEKDADVCKINGNAFQRYGD